MAIVTLRPNGDGTTTGWSVTGGSGSHASAIVDDPNSNDADSSYVLSPNVLDGTMFVALDDVPGDFDPAAINSITIRVAHRRLNTPAMAVDGGAVNAFLTRSDELTAISTTPTPVASPIQAGYALTTFTPSPTGTHVVADWNGARLALVFDHTSAQTTDTVNQIRITAVEVEIDYTPLPPAALTPDPVVVSLVASAPTVSDVFTVEPSAVAVTVSVVAPTIATTVSMASVSRHTGTRGLHTSISLMVRAAPTRFGWARQTAFMPVAVSATPSAVVMTLSVVTPTVVREAVVIPPATVAAVFGVSQPAVVVGTRTLTPTPVVVALAAGMPTVVRGAVSAAPSAVPAVITVATPSVVRGVVVVSPSAVAAALTAVTPVVRMDQTVASSSVSMAMVVTAPLVSQFVQLTSTSRVSGAVGSHTSINLVVRTAPSRMTSMRTTFPGPFVISMTLAPSRLGWARMSTATVVARTMLTTAPIVSLTVTTPTVVSGGVVVTPSAVVVGLSATTPNIVEGVGASPQPVVAALSVVTPSVLRSALTLTPIPLTIVVTVVTPVVEKITTITPAATAFAGVITTPVVARGALALTPTVALANFVTMAPAVVRGSLALTPNAATILFSAPTPVSIGNIRVLTPGALLAAFSTTTPTTVLGARTLVPSPTVALFSVVSSTLFQVRVIDAKYVQASGTSAQRNASGNSQQRNASGNSQQRKASDS